MHRHHQMIVRSEFNEFEKSVQGDSAHRVCCRVHDVRAGADRHFQIGYIQSSSIDLRGRITLVVDRRTNPNTHTSEKSMPKQKEKKDSIKIS